MIFIIYFEILLNKVLNLLIYNNKMMNLHKKKQKKYRTKRINYLQEVNYNDNQMV